VKEGLLQRVEELKLLGWSQDGALQYARLYESSNEKILNSDIYLLFGSIFVLIFGITLIAYLRGNQNRKGGVLDPACNRSDSVVLNVPYQNKNSQKNHRNQDILLGFINLNNIKESINDIYKYVDNAIILFLFCFLLAFEAIFFIYQFMFLLSRALFLDFGNHAKYLKIKSQLSNISDDELKAFIKIDDLSDLISREQMIDIITLSPNLTKLLNINQRRKELNKKKKLELKLLLNGFVGISSLKKDDLITKILIEEFGSDLTRSSYLFLKQ
tara:strand:- start:5719 stop:6531 length:813 start_codon:yes stop_codon:yes gene_type:complete